MHSVITCGEIWQQRGNKKSSYISWHIQNNTQSFPFRVPCRGGGFSIYYKLHFGRFAWPIFKCQVIWISLTVSAHIFATSRNNNNILCLIAAGNEKKNMRNSAQRRQMKKCRTPGTIRSSSSTIPLHFFPPLATFFFLWSMITTPDSYYCLRKTK